MKNATMHSGTQVVTVFDVDLTVIFEYSEITPEKLGSSVENSYPASGGEVTLLSIFINDWYVFDLLSDKVKDIITQQIKDGLSEFILSRQEGEKADGRTYNS